MSYYIDLSGITLDEFMAGILEADLLPSQQVLLEEPILRFQCLAKNGIRTMADLQTKLKTKKKLTAFAEQSGLPADFLTVLRREVNSYHPKPNTIKQFPGIPADAVRKLESLGIKHTLHLFERIRDEDARRAFAEESGTALELIKELARLTDLSRIKWVGPIFARLLLEAGYGCAREVAEADPAELWERVSRVNDEKGYYKGKLGLNDIKLCVRVAALVPDSIEF